MSVVPFAAYRDRAKDMSDLVVLRRDLQIFELTIITRVRMRFSPQVGRSKQSETAMSRDCCTIFSACEGQKPAMYLFLKNFSFLELFLLSHRTRMQRIATLDSNRVFSLFPVPIRVRSIRQRRYPVCHSSRFPTLSIFCRRRYHHILSPFPLLVQLYKVII
jgi:hypothetical protein